MPYRSPARFLAPIALLLVAVAIFSTVRANSGDDTDDSPATTQSTTERATTSERRTTTASKRRKSSSSKTYTVKPGDVLSAIAEETGVPLATIQELNPDVDAQSLRSGQKLKLAE